MCVNNWTGGIETLNLYAVRLFLAQSRDRFLGGIIEVICSDDIDSTLLQQFLALVYIGAGQSHDQWHLWSSSPTNNQRQHHHTCNN
jgi:hypothetical protein